jgi:hypothetical protein
MIEAKIKIKQSEIRAKCQKAKRSEIEDIAPGIHFRMIETNKKSSRVK